MSATNRTLARVIVAVVLIVALVVLLFLARRWHQDQMESSREQSQEQCLAFIRTLETELEELRAQLVDQSQLPPADEIYPQVFGTTAPATDGNVQPINCDALEAQLKAFYDYLDSRDPQAGWKEKGGAAGFFRQSAALLLANPPINVAEMQQVERLIRNVTHFYRMLGKERLLTAQTLLAQEGQVVEPAMALFYAWVVQCRRPLPGDEKALAEERLYDYACYFLNTLGGRSYLLRRESRLRMLVNYYAILLVDRANDAKYNQYGVDVRPYIDYLFYDLSHQKGLAYRQRYLTQLTALRDKYLMN